MTDINKLEELAKAATPGPWIATPDGPLWVKREGDEYGRGWRANRANDAAYVAAVNPVTLLTLISQYRRMEEALRAADAWLECWASHVGACRGGGLCECGLTAIQYETRGSLQDQDQ